MVKVDACDIMRRWISNGRFSSDGGAGEHRDTGCYFVVSATRRRGFVVSLGMVTVKGALEPHINVDQKGENQEQLP